MDFLCTVCIQEIDRFLELCAADNRIVDKKQLLVLNEVVDRDLLHMRDPVPLRLVDRHEGTCPSWRIFDESPCEGDPRFVCVADRVRGAGIRNAADIIDILCLSALLVVLTDPFLRERRLQHEGFFRMDFHNFTGTEFHHLFKIQLLQRKRLK